MTPIYHITHIDNLASILRAGGLYCENERQRLGIKSENIAYQSLKTRRANTNVPTGGGVLADYVPFYFANRSPMLLANVLKYVQESSAIQDDIVYLVSSVESVTQTNCIWCFTDGHPLLQVTRFWSGLGDLEKVDFPLINDWRWKNTEQDPDRKRRKQAEFLVKSFFRWEWVEKIGVRRWDRREQILKLLAGIPHQPPVEIRPKWYVEER